MRLRIEIVGRSAWHWHLLIMERQTKGFIVAASA
jgi:hypothetical protein